jgi:hypothetical protein
MEKWKFFTLPGSNSDLSVILPVASRYTDFSTAAREVERRDSLHTYRV